VRPRNEGYTKALIFGLEKVCSGTLGILDSDDALVADAIEKVYAVHAQDRSLGSFYPKSSSATSNLEPLYVTMTTPEHTKEPLLWIRGTTAFRSFKMAAYARTTGLDERMTSGEDADLLFKLEEVAPVRRLDEGSYRYRQIRSSKVQGSALLQCDIFLHSHGQRIVRIGAGYRTTIPNLQNRSLKPGCSLRSATLSELGAPLQAALFATRAIWVGRSMGSAQRALSAAVRASSLRGLVEPMFD